MILPRATLLAALGFSIAVLGVGPAGGDEPTPAQNKHHVHIKGTVRDMTGAPMAGVRVSPGSGVVTGASACATGWSYTGATTGADGSYDIKVYFPATAACSAQFDAITIDRTKIRLEKYGFSFQPVSP